MSTFPSPSQPSLLKSSNAFRRNYCSLLFLTRSTVNHLLPHLTFLALGFCSGPSMIFLSLSSFSWTLWSLHLLFSLMYSLLSCTYLPSYKNSIPPVWIVCWRSLLVSSPFLLFSFVAQSWQDLLLTC